VQAEDPTWLDGETIEFANGLRWRPSLVQRQPPALLYVHLVARIPRYVISRLEIAAIEGYQVHLALPLSALYDAELVDKLVDLDASVHLLDDMKPSAPQRTLLAIARSEIKVEPKVRAQLAGTGWSLASQAAPNHMKGRRLEALVAFLLSQVSDYRVIETNLRTDTEELDVVVQRRGLGNYCWSFQEAPFLIAECKNWSSPVGQPEVSILRMKMQGRRGSVRIGLLFGANGFTSDASMQELRFASENLTIAFFGPEDIEAWATAADWDAWLDRYIGAAMLR
jgi:Restriction endonuclease